MTAILSRNTASRQAQLTRYYDVALKRGSAIIVGMRKSEMNNEISEHQRAAIKKVMAERNLRVNSWCIESGVAESTLREFLNGKVAALSANTLYKLARTADTTIGELLGEPLSEIDESLIDLCMKQLEKTSTEKKMQMETEEHIKAIVAMYNHIIERRRRGEDLKPNSSMASLILVKNK